MGKSSKLPRQRVRIHPLSDRLVISPIEQDDRTEGGLYVPEQAKEKPQQGKVVAAGLGRYRNDSDLRFPMEVGVGDVVLYGKFSGTELAIDNEKYVIVRESDVLGIMDDDEALGSAL